MTCPTCGNPDVEINWKATVAYCLRCHETFPTGQVQTSLRRFRHG